MDLLYGARVDGQSFARLVWTSPTTPDEVRLTDYLIQRSLAEYDAALAKKMPELIEETIATAKAEIDRRNIDIGETADVHELEKTHDLLDRMENDFFKRMREELDKRE